MAVPAVYEAPTQRRGDGTIHRVSLKKIFPQPHRLHERLTAMRDLPPAIGLVSGTKKRMSFMGRVPYRQTFSLDPNPAIHSDQFAAQRAPTVPSQNRIK